MVPYEFQRGGNQMMRIRGWTRCDDYSSASCRSWDFGLGGDRLEEDGAIPMRGGRCRADHRRRAV